MIKLFLFINVFFKNRVELHSGTHKLCVDFSMILSIWVCCTLFEEVLLLGEVLAWSSGISEDGQHDATVPFWSWCHSPSSHHVLVHTKLLIIIQAPLNLTHILHYILWLWRLKPSLSWYAFRFATNLQLRWLCLELRQISPELLIHRPIHIRIIIALQVDWLLQIQLFLHVCIGQIVLDVIFAHLALSYLVECLEVIVDQSFELAFYFIIDFGEFALKCHLVSEYFFCAVERLIRHHLWGNEASCFLRLHILEF